MDMIEGSVAIGRCLSNWILSCGTGAETVQIMAVKNITKYHELCNEGTMVDFGFYALILLRVSLGLSKCVWHPLESGEIS